MEAPEDPVRLLRGTVPPWFGHFPSRTGTVVGRATIPVNASDGAIVVDLEIAKGRNGLRVRERSARPILPSWCPERHINDDGWFCLGLAAEVQVGNATSADEWWDKLRAFLRLQRVAARTGLWPEQHALSHGAAGEHHLAALKIADAAGLTNDYENLSLGEPSLLGTLLPFLIPSGERLINGRAACPCGRTRKGVSTLRRKCPKRSMIIALLREERLRKAALDAFWKAMVRDGRQCCGTMVRCPLNRPQAPEPTLLVA